MKLSEILAAILLVGIGFGIRSLMGSDSQSSGSPVILRDTLLVRDTVFVEPIVVSGRGESLAPDSSYKAERDSLLAKLKNSENREKALERIIDEFATPYEVTFSEKEYWGRAEARPLRREIDLEINLKPIVTEKLVLVEIPCPYEHNDPKTDALSAGVGAGAGATIGALAGGAPGAIVGGAAGAVIGIVVTEIF